MTIKKIIFQSNFNLKIILFLLLAFAISINKINSQTSNINTFKPFGNDTYIFSWSINENTNKTTMSLDTPFINGWTGIGFSPEGKKLNSGMVICFLNKNQTANCTDRFGGGKLVPDLDIALNGTENLENVTSTVSNGRVKFTFTRDLKNNDKTDYQFEKGKEVKVFFSYRKEGNPETEKFLYKPHTAFILKTLVIYPIQGQYVKGIDFQSDPSVQKMSLKLEDYLIPTTNSSFVCVDYNVTRIAAEITKLPNGTSYHAIAFEVVPDKTEFLHHINIFSCDTGVDLIQEKQIECSTLNLICKKNPIAFLNLFDAYKLPEDTGILWGVQENKNIILQFYYTNLLKSENIKDSSSVNVYFTNELRDYDTGTTILGVADKLLTVPSNNPNWSVNDRCDLSCTSLMRAPIYVYSVFFQGNNLLRKIRTEITYKNGTVDNSTLRNDNFNYSSQKYINLDKFIKIEPGDEMKTFCEYNSTDSNNTIVGGEGLNNEKCTSYLNFYARENGLSKCMGIVDFGCLRYDKFNKTIQTTKVKLKTDARYVNSLSIFGFLFVILMGFLF